MPTEGRTTQDLTIAGFVLTVAALIIPTSAIPALIVGTIALLRGQVMAGAVMMFLAPLLGIAGALFWYDALGLNELLFYPDRPGIPYPTVD